MGVDVCHGECIVGLGVGSLILVLVIVVVTLLRGRPVGFRTVAVTCRDLLGREGAFRFDALLSLPRLYKTTGRLSTSGCTCSVARVIDFVG